MGSGDTTITVQGNLTAQPEIRYLPSGVAVASMTIASTPRKFDKTSSSWVDEETWFVRASAFRDLAENVAESLDKGTAVIAVGRLKARSYDAKDSGEKKTVLELELDTIGVDLRRATAKVNRTQRGAGSGGFGGASNSGGGFGGNSGGAAQAEDPWATSAKSREEPPPF